MCARAHKAAVSRAEAARTSLDSASASLAAQVKRREKVSAALAAMPSAVQPNVAAEEAGIRTRRVRIPTAADLPSSPKASGKDLGGSERQDSPAARHIASPTDVAATLPDSPAAKAGCTYARAHATSSSAQAAERSSRGLHARGGLCTSDASSPERSPRVNPCSSPPAGSPGAARSIRARTRGGARRRQGDSAAGAPRRMDDSAEDSDTGAAAAQGPQAARRQGPHRAARVRQTTGAGSSACGSDDLEQELLALAAEEDHLAVLLLFLF